MDSLEIDKIFYSTIKADTTIKTLTGGRIFNPARDSEDEKLDKVPYIIITYDGMRGETFNKDYDTSIEDVVTISVMVCADDRDSLATLTKRVRSVVNNGLRDDDDVSQFDVTAGTIYYDFTKPCQFQTLTYTVYITQIGISA